MSSYLAKLKVIENEKNLNISPRTELTKLTEVPFGGFVSATPGQIEKNILLIQSWLFQICEPEEDHYLVLDKCRINPEAMQYFLKHTRGEYEANNP